MRAASHLLATSEASRKAAEAAKKKAEELKKSKGAEKKDAPTLSTVKEKNDDMDVDEVGASEAPTAPEWTFGSSFAIPHQFVSGITCGRHTTAAIYFIGKRVSVLGAAGCRRYPVVRQCLLGPDCELNPL